MHIVVADRSLERFARDLEEAVPSATWAYHGPRDDRAIQVALGSAEVFVGSRFPAFFAEHAPALRLVQAAGAGTDAIDVSALAPGVVLAHVFEHERSIAEHVLMVMLALSRELLPADRSLRAGRWISAAHDPALPLHRGLAGRSVGILGFGHIGRQIARLCASLGMSVRAIRRAPREGEGSENGDLDFLGGLHDLPAVLQDSDFVVVCVPLSDQTRDMIGRQELELMRSDAYLINVARGPVVEENSLYVALRDRRIAGAGIDVWYEPAPMPGRVGLPSTLPFGELDNVVLTPHYSGVTEDTFRRRARVIGANLARLAAGEEIHNRVR